MSWQRSGLRSSGKRDIDGIRVAQQPMENSAATIDRIFI
jgi:hypothetical protein